MCLCFPLYTLTDHLHHLRQVFDRIREAGLKLKPTKCRFVAPEVEYLGHVLTPEGLKTNPATVSAVREFPVPTNLKEVGQFLGLVPSIGGSSMVLLRSLNPFIG